MKTITQMSTIVPTIPYPNISLLLKDIALPSSSGMTPFGTTFTSELARAWPLNENPLGLSTTETRPVPCSIQRLQTIQEQRQGWVIDW
jgi:hypothetical protein